ncbi:hypothetical protein ABEB36_006529 [Hypothenemus hampei]|uniref:Uncharacterized protein n=1 Tax=Hypothenemus hampei TaxID=57062 RepID=A0ABD1EQU1_HYPHA
MESNMRQEASQELSFNEVLPTLNRLVNVRKKAIDSIQKIAEIKAAQLQKCLEQSEIELKPDLQVKENGHKLKSMEKRVNFIFKALASHEKDLDKQIKEREKEVLLLKIMKDKMDCPSGQIIDQI